MERLPRKILVVSLDNLGDTVMGLSLAPPLAKAFPDASVAVWTKSYCRDVPPRSPSVSRTFHCEPFWTGSPGTARGSLRDFRRAIAEIRRARFDLALVLHADWRRALACIMAGIPARAGCAQRKSGPFLTRTIAPTQPGEHLMDTHQRLLASFGISATLTCRLEPSPGVEREAMVGIHPFAGDPSRRWPFECWLPVFDGLLERGWRKMLVIASPWERERHRDLFQAWGWRLGGAMELSSDLVRDVSRCGFFIGHDSGPLHLASALGVPSVGFYLTWKKPIFEPRGQAPCRVLASERIEEIPVGDVLEAAHALPRARVDA